MGSGVVCLGLATENRIWDRTGRALDSVFLGWTFGWVPFDVVMSILISTFFFFFFF